MKKSTETGHSEQTCEESAQLDFDEILKSGSS